MSSKGLAKVVSSETMSCLSGGLRFHQCSTLLLFRYGSIVVFHVRKFCRLSLEILKEEKGWKRKSYVACK